jgi:hypothetical protein
MAPMSRPRRRAGENSAMRGQPTAYSVPIAMPISNRTTRSSTGESTKNCIPEATANSPMSNMKIGLRPNLSAAQPPSGEPIRIPIRAAAAISPCQTTSS